MTHTCVDVPVFFQNLPSAQKYNQYFTTMSCPLPPQNSGCKYIQIVTGKKDYTKHIFNCFAWVQGSVQSESLDWTHRSFALFVCVFVFLNLYPSFAATEAAPRGLQHVKTIYKQYKFSKPSHLKTIPTYIATNHKTSECQMGVHLIQRSLK